MTISRIGRTPMGAFYRSKCGVLAAANNKVLFSDWRVLNRATPDVNTGPPPVLEMLTNNIVNTISYQKALIGKLKTPIKAKINRKLKFKLDTANIQTSQDYFAQFNGMYDDYIISNSTFTYDIYMVYIVEDFDIDEIVWNDYFIASGGGVENDTIKNTMSNDGQILIQQMGTLAKNFGENQGERISDTRLEITRNFEFPINALVTQPNLIIYGINFFIVGYPGPNIPIPGEKTNVFPAFDFEGDITLNGDPPYVLKL